MGRAEMGALRRGLAAGLPLLAASGCRGIQAALDPAGPQAERVSELFWMMVVVCTVVFAIVAGFLFAALFRRRSGDAGDRQAEDRRSTRAVTLGAIATAVILIFFVVASVTANRAISLRSDEPILVEVTGHQWWWRFRVRGPQPSDTVETANELHIPAGHLVKLELQSRDVIHSFWVPNLQGKVDLIPGHTTELWLKATRPGVYRGQCAEFCGLQHAHMGLLLVVEPMEDWQRWIERQRQPARAPRTAAEARGRKVFLSSPCVLCHAIRGTGAFGRVGPDLTHLASRRTLGAATLPNRRGHLGGWVIDSQSVKPGNFMPPVQLGSQELQDLLTYLESLD